ncbi:MAG: chorismate synthase [Magnetococcales bacterium]|nr:chorismate synthase [Magnetococcales bacterium]MBF0152078.1 chorismate synthase [Magnetococcales bacterium]MBF0175151.1 chorismate synthase [Magnetococcales bacterium]MBF0632988.1 chorismate synthase [Magnetococcales bacterium]
MSSNVFGTLFRLMTFGESHGLEIGAVIDGCPAGMALDAADIQRDLDRRRPGQSRYTTQRREEDRVRIVSGVFEGRTTGTPIGLMIENQDQRARDYNEIKQLFRPGHADWTYWKKYGIRDYRGGGRASARETAMRVAGGAIARKVLRSLGVEIQGCLIAMGPVKIDPNRKNWGEVAQNPFFCPDSESVAKFEELLDRCRSQGDSVGAMLEVVARGVPVGWGEPVYGRLDADLAAGMMGINAVKSVEIGAGSHAAEGFGSQMADEMIPDAEAPEGVRFASNHSGGILGGISNGNEIVVRLAVKPTPSIHSELRTVNTMGLAQIIQTRGRHDPCVGIRAVPVAEAMMALVLVDHYLRHRARAGIFKVLHD